MSRRNTERWLQSREQFISKVQKTAAATSVAALGVLSRGAEIEEPGRNWHGRLPGSANLRRGKSSWVTDYLGETPLYPLRSFRRRFRVPRALMLKIAQDLMEFNPDIWKTRVDAAGRSGQQTEVKVMVCLRVLGSGCSLEDVDDKARMAPETVRYYMKHFVKDIQAIYGSDYLNRYSGRVELQRIAAKYADDGFVGCIGAVDCCHLAWKNCPLEEKGQYHNPKDSKLAVMKVEAWCDSDLFIWHWHAGHAGTSNDKKMVNFSPLFQAILNGHYGISLDEYTVTENSMSRTLAYLLGDGIYPRWPIFLLPIHQAQSTGEKK